MTKHKILFLLVIILIVVVCLSSIPYWTGIEAERKLTHFNDSFYPTLSLKPVDMTYQRGWFHSKAETLVETVGFSSLGANQQRLLLVHEIDHGFMPLQSVLILTTLYPSTDIDAPLNKPESDEDEGSLLEVRTAIQVNGDSVSTLSMPTLAINDQNARLQWQGLQGSVYVKRDFAMLQADIYMPEVQLETASGEIVIQGVMLNAELQPNEAVLMSGKGSLSLADVQLKGKQTPFVKLEGSKLEGSNDVESDYLSVLPETDLQQIQVETERYGPGYSDFELHHWHVPTLSRIKNIVADIGIQGLFSQQQTNVAMFKLMLMPEGLALLKQSPELAITRLHFITNEGDLQGTVRLKMEPFDINIFALLMKPSLLLNSLNAELDLQISQSLYNWTQETKASKETASQNRLGQYLKTLLSQGILIPAADQPDYYRSQIQLKKGVLEVNGQQLPLETLLNNAK